MSIPIINVDNVNPIQVPNVIVPSWMYQHPNVDHLVPPVVVNIGNPIIDMPGCVKMHQDNQYHKSGLPVDRNLVQDDPDKAMIVCDAEVPSYDAMNYEPENLLITRETPPPPVQPPPTPPEFKPQEIPKTNIEDVPCPGPNQLRIGDLTQSGDERVTGHRLLEDGKTCETLYESTTVAEKFLPPLNQASTVTALAVVATAGAAATPLLIRVIKPVIKKLWTTVQKKIGKEPPRLSRSDVTANEYRAKRGLPPIKKK